MSSKETSGVDIRKLKNSRQGHLAHLTKLHREIDQLLGSNVGVGFILDKQENLNVAFIKFQAAHFEYSEQVDVETKQQLANHLREDFDEHEICMAKVKGWLNNQAASVTVAGDTEEQDQNENYPTPSSSDKPTAAIGMEHVLSTVVNLPKMELLPFDGNPLHYWSFINSFKGTIEEEILSPRKRLMYLIQFCKAEAKECIENCVLLPVEDGYNTALTMLKQQFGRPHTVAQAHLKDLTDGPALKNLDSSGLRSFSRKLQRTQIVLQSMKYDSDLNSTEYLKRICKKLPFHLQAKWAEKAEQILRTDNYPKFNDLTEFVQRQASIANNVFGQSLNDKPKKEMKTEVLNFKPTKSVRSQSSSYSVEVKSRTANEGQCYHCTGNHPLDKCTTFLNLSQHDKFDVLKTNHLCLNCLQKGHSAKGCFRNGQCQVKDCSRKHHTLFHRHENQKEPQRDPVIEVASNSAQTVPTEAGGVCLKIVPVMVSSMDQLRSVKTYALLDSGSNVTLCSKKLTRLLGVSGQEKKFAVTTVNNREKLQKGCEIGLKISSVDGKEDVVINNVWTVDSLNVSTDYLPCERDVRKWEHLKDVKFPQIPSSEVLLIIGSNSPESFWVQEERRGKKGEPYAIRCPFGWTVVGPVCNSRKPAVVNFVHCNDSLQSSIEQFWKYDFEIDGKDCMSIEDKMVLQQMNESCKLVNNHYQIGMPWKSWPLNPPNNRQSVLRRFEMLRNRLKKDPRLKCMYQQTMQSYLERSFARKIDVRNEKDKPVWYLPHHPVLNVNKPNKVRIVFDCSAKQESISLNDMLYHGPDLANDLIGVLIRFRQFKYAMMADIETMYYQVQVAPRDRKMLRFFWVENNNINSQPTEYEMLVHLFGATSSPSCAVFALKRTADDNSGEFDECLTNMVHKSFYIDDCLLSIDSLDDARTAIQNLCQLLKKGGFRLTKWISNSHQLNKEVPEVDRSSKVNKTLDPDDSRVLHERALGVKWDINHDEFFFDLNLKSRPMTKRGVMSVISSIYDPLGFIAPSILKGKLIMQMTFKQTKGWDQPLDESTVLVYTKWLKSLSSVAHVKIRRWLQKEPSDAVASRHLVVFCDASEAAYCAVAYLRSASKTGEVSCVFVMGKCRLAPLKPITIPRLELSAAVLGVQLSQKICQEMELPLDDVVFYTDSTAVMQYIRSESRRFKTFVANRVSKIREGSSITQWRHIAGNQNPADDATRCNQSKRWLIGPEFLRTSEFIDGTKTMSKHEEVNENDLEVKRNAIFFAASSSDFISKLCARCSSWFKLKKLVAWLNRFKEFIINKNRKLPILTGELKVKELQSAEVIILRNVQEDIVKKSILRLKPISDGKLMMVGGRLSSAKLKTTAKHPIILPKDNHVTRLIIDWYHRTYGHVGREHVLALIRQRYWPIHARSAIRKVLTKCVECKRFNAKPSEQIMADLPPDRLEYGIPPFTNVGIDCFGPFLVTVKRSKVKRYGCLFTCLNTRAIHIEVLFTMETDSFIQALKRFVSRRGMPSLIRSDQGTNFVGTEKRLSKFLLERNIRWIFNCPSAPHMGGVWERMIRTVKRVLTNLLKNVNTNDEILTTVMAETENIVNSRPITPNSDDPNDLEALTPNHLLILKSGHLFPPSEDNPEQACKRGWRQAQHLSHVFWKRWVREYLPEMQERKKWLKESLNLKEGDLVVIMYEKTSRGKWPLARIVNVYRGSDGNVRSALVKTGKSHIVRPIHKLCKLF